MTHPTRILVPAAALWLAAACAPSATPIVVAPEPAVERQQPPAPLSPRPVEFPPFQEFTLANGLQVIVVEHPTVPLVNLNLYVRAGEARDPAERAGLAGLTAELLTKGTATRNARQISETIEGVGGTLNSFAQADWLNLSASVLPEHLPLGFELLSDVALRPSFPQDEVELARRRTLSGLQAALGQPGTIAQRRFAMEVYGGQHPYGISPVPGTVEGIQRAHLTQFHREHFGPQNALLVISGAVTRQQAEELARRHFGEWRGAAAGAFTFPQPPAREQTRIYLVHRPGSVQSNIRVGHVGVRPDSPDYFALQVLNGVLGGGVDARLFQILREEKGWTYGAYSRFTRPADVGFFSAEAEVRTEVTDSAVAEILHQLRRLRDEPVPAAEIEATKNFLAGSFPLRIETPGQIAGQIAQARLLGVPIEQITRYREGIRQVTAADVQRVARTHVRPGQAAIVIVGDAARVLPMVEGIAPVVLYDVEGRTLERSAVEVRAATERYDASGLRASTARYEMRVQGQAMGSATEVLRREGGEWVAQTTVTSPFLNQEATVRFRDDFTPVSAQSTTQGQVTISSDLRMVDGRVQGRAELPAEMGGTRDFDTEVVAGTLLPGIESYVLTSLELREGMVLTLPIFNAESGAATNVTFTVRGAQQITTPAGSFDSWQVEMTGPQNLMLYIRRDGHPVVVRQEILGLPVPVSLELTALED